MGKYTSYTQKEIPPKGETHEIWSGFGCVIMLIIPVISYAAGMLTVNWIVDNGWRLIPRELLGIPQLPDIVYKSEGLSFLFLWMTDIKNLYAYIVVGLVYMLLISGVVSVIYAAVYRVIGPSRYTPLDAPPPKIKVVKKSR
jgi:hypothetical protein